MSFAGSSICCTRGGNLLRSLDGQCNRTIDYLVKYVPERFMKREFVFSSINVTFKYI